MRRMAGDRKGITDFLGVKYPYGNHGLQMITDEAREIAAITQENVRTANAGMQARADIESAKHYAAAEAAIGAAQGQAALVGGIASGVKGLAGFMPEGGLFNKEWKDASSIGFPGNQVNSLGRLRY